MNVTLSGEYVVDAVFDDGPIVLRLESSAVAIGEPTGVEPVTNDEFERAFGYPSTRSEG